MTESPSKSPRLSKRDVHPFEIVLFEPEIPLNVGSIARTCACSGCPLHLVGTLGFRLDDRLAKRAGLDYWEHADVRVHKCWEDFKTEMDGRRMWFFSTKGRKSYWDVKFDPGDLLVFGSERTGLPGSLLESDRGVVVTIPMLENRRSLNLSNTVAIALYEALRQNIPE